MRYSVCLVGLALSVLATEGAEPIAPNDVPNQLEAQLVLRFDRLHSLIKPKAEEEKWTQIPWLTSLWEARKRAAQEGKPILLWEMDGHPLGCT